MTFLNTLFIVHTCSSQLLQFVNGIYRRHCASFTSPPRCLQLTPDPCVVRGFSVLEWREWVNAGSVLQASVRGSGSVQFCQRLGRSLGQCIPGGCLRASFRCLAFRELCERQVGVFMAECNKRWNLTNGFRLVIMGSERDGKTGRGEKRKLDWAWPVAVAAKRLTRVFAQAACLAKLTIAIGPC